MNWKQLSLIFLLVVPAFSNVVYDDLEPDTTNTWSLGTATYQWKDAFGDGILDWDTITDGTFVVSGGQISAGEIVATFGDINLGGNTLTARSVISYGGPLIVHSTEDPQFIIRHTFPGVESTFRVDDFGDMIIIASGGDIRFDDENLTTTGLFNGLRLRELADNNICIGDGAGLTGQLGDNNIYIGLDAGSSTTLGGSNTFVGYISGASLTSGGYNVGIGSFSLGGSLTTGEKNTAIGEASGHNAIGDNNIFIGYTAGLFETGSNTLIIDSVQRANEAQGRARALMYGITDATAANQSLRVNADFTVHGDDVWFQTVTDSTQSFSIFDADGGTPIFNVDTTNERVGIGTASPDSTLQVVGETRLGADVTDYTKFSGSSGLMTMHGDARVKNELILDASNFRIPATNPANEGEIQIASSTIYTPVFEFDPTGVGADEQIFIRQHMPEFVDGSVNAQIHIVWQPDDGDGGADNYEWNIDYIVTSDSDFDYTAGSATTITEDVTPADAVTVLETKFSDTIDIDNDQILWARIWLDKSDSGADDDGNLIFVEIEFVQNTIGEPFAEYYLLLETGDFLLLETGDKLILEGI